MEQFAQFESMHINEIISMAKNNNRLAYHYIVEKYKGIVHGTIKKKNYFLQGGDYEDLLQEGLFGIYKAVKDFKETVKDEHGKEKKSDFESFLKICIDRQLISAIKTSTRKKHTPLNEMIPFDRPLPENDNLTMMDIFGARDEVQHKLDFESLDPEQQLILNETQQIQQRMLDETLSEKEKSVYYLYLEDKSYKEIMEDLGVDSPKMIDNAIQRVKRKIEKIKNCDLINDNDFDEDLKDA